MEDDRNILRPVQPTPISIIDALYGLFADGSDMLSELEAEHAAEIEPERSKWGAAGTAAEFNAPLLTDDPQL